MSTGNRPRPSAAPPLHKPKPLPKFVGLHSVAAAYLTLSHVLNELYWLGAKALQDGHGREAISHINAITKPWDEAEKVVRSGSAAFGIPFTTFDPLLVEALRKMRALTQVAGGDTRAEFSAFDWEHTRILERLKQLAHSIPRLGVSDADTIGSIELLLAECPPRPPEPPAGWIEIAAMHFANELFRTGGGGRNCEGEQREMRLATVPAMARRKHAPTPLDPNVMLWAVRKLAESKLVTIQHAPGGVTPKWSEVQRRKLAGQPVKDEHGNHLPGVATVLPPASFVRSAPELWKRWRAGAMFPDLGKPPPGIKVLPKPKPTIPPIAVVASELKRLEGLRITKPAALIAYMRMPEGKPLRQAVDAAKKAKPNKKRSGKPATDKSILSAAKQRNRRPNATS